MQVLIYCVATIWARPQGNGQINQYQYINGAGEAKFGYVSEFGNYHRSQRLPNGEVFGEYGYIDSNGVPVSFRYTAGIGGYVVVPSTYNPNAVKDDIPTLIAPADLSDALWESAYDFTSSGQNSDFRINARRRTDESVAGLGNNFEFALGPV